MTMYTQAAKGPHFQVLLMSEQAAAPGAEDEECKEVTETRYRFYKEQSGNRTGLWWEVVVYKDEGRQVVSLEVNPHLIRLLLEQETAQKNVPPEQKMLRILLYRHPFFRHSLCFFFPSRPPAFVRKGVC